MIKNNQRVLVADVVIVLFSSTATVPHCMLKDLRNAEVEIKMNMSKIKIMTRYEHKM